MRNPFKNKFKRKAKEEAEKRIKEPWKKKPETKKHTQNPKTATNKTIVGKRPDKEFLDKKDERSSFGSGYQCPKCSYPLRMQASVNYPCPNCGFTGTQEKVQNDPTLRQNAKTTINFGNLNFGPVSGQKKFTLVNESSPDMSVSADLGEEHEIVLGREELDPDNPSISGEGHLHLREQSGRWFVKDVSSNGATFIQAASYMPIYEGMRLILGNRIFRTDTGDGGNTTPPSTNKTMQFGQFNLSNGSDTKAITLHDEVSGLAKKFTGEQIELNRFNIDPDEQSISGKLHAVLENQDGHWLVIDKSSNKATFVQVISEIQLQDQTRLILGNKVFRFSLG